MAHRLKGAPTSYPVTDGETASEDEEVSHTHSRRRLNSGKVRTMDSLVTKRIQLPHEMVFTSQSQLPLYEELSFATADRTRLGSIGGMKMGKSN